MAKRAREASSSGERWLPEVLPEHTIFLSHSKHDKPFVERLCEQLERLNYSPFFDQNSDSLPRGERFTSHLFKAAEQCLVAVIVLFEGYLTSKWPLLELVTFVKAQRTKNPNMKLLPLFYKLSPSDLVPEKWMKSWEELELDEEDEILPDVLQKLLAEAVKILRPFNGLEFSKYGTSEGRFIQAVVDEIFKIIPPMKYTTYEDIDAYEDGVRGYRRMCEKASSLFEEGIDMNDVCKPGCLYLGFYGMGGVGKTTLCGAMCSFYEIQFRGRVCRVELQSDTKYERIERLKHVVRQLGGLDYRIVELITEESEGFKMLKKRLKSQPRAFLAVDNVGDSESSRDEARRFIRSVLAYGSKVMVTSRSRLILESVLGEAKYCKPIPRLEEQEAEELFLSVAIPPKLLSPLQPGEDVIVKACIQECKFLDDGYDTQQYHPLVLRALGTFFHDVDKDDIMEWKEALMFEKKLQASRESKNVNDILGLNYATLSDGQKLLFLDVVFLFNLEKSSLLLMKVKMRSWEDEFKWAISMIATMHGISTLYAKMKVKELQWKSLIYESSPTLRTHDLYIEFAQSLVAMEGSKEKEWWVGHKDANRYNALKRLLLFEDASMFEGISNICHPPKQLWECQNLECLIMRNCKVTLQRKLDLKCFTNLRLLIITDYTTEEYPLNNDTEILCTNGEALCCDLNFYGRMDQNIRCLPELQMVKLFGFDLRRIPFLGHCCNLTFLSVDNCDFDILDFNQDGTSLFENLKALETLLLSSIIGGQVPSCVFDGILRVATKLKNLKCLEIDLRWSKLDGDGFCKLDLSPLGPLTSFQTLSLPQLPHCVEELIGLDQLSQLIELNLWNSMGLQKLPNLDLLPNLQRICVAVCLDLKFPKDQLKCFQKLHSKRFHRGYQCLEPGSHYRHTII